MIRTHPRNTRINLCWRTRLNWHWTKWRKKRVMSRLKKFPTDSLNSQTPRNIWSFLSPCLTIIESFSVLKTSNRFLNKKRNKEVLRYHRYCQVRRKSCMKRPRKWLINTVGLFSLINQLALVILTLILSCNSNPKFCRTRKLIAISMKLWWCSQLVCFSRHLTNRIFPSSKRRSTDCSGLMLLTFRRGCSSMRSGRRNTPA